MEAGHRPGGARHRLRVGEETGRRGFGEVWLGRDKRLKTERVFKFCFRADRVRSTQPLAEQDKANSGWQRDLIVTLYKVGTTTAEIGGKHNVTQAQGFLRAGLALVDKYSGLDRQQLVDALNQALQQLLH